MVDFNVELIKKIVRLLESDHDGERAAAAGKLRDVSKANGKNIDEMLAAVYGGGARSKPKAAYEHPQRKQSSWGNEWGGGNFQDAPWESSYETRRRQQESAKKRQEEEPEERDAWNRAAREGKRYDDARDELQQCLNQWGKRVLTPWEREFVDSIFDWKGALTSAQEATVLALIEKFANLGKRNGDADAFWGA